MADYDYSSIELSKSKQAFGLDEYCHNLKFLYYRVVAECNFWRNNQIAIKINVSNIETLAGYLRNINLVFNSKEISEAEKNCLAWLEKFGQQAQLSKSEVEEYYKLLSKTFDAIFPKDTNNRVILLKRYERFNNAVRLLSDIDEVKADVIDCRNALSVGLGTAAVFHISRAVEWSVRHLAKQNGIKIPPNQLNWQNISDKLNVYLNDMPNKTPLQKRKKKRFAGILNHLNSIRVAWRNDVMHPGGHYNVEQAEIIFDNCLTLLKEIFDFSKISRKVTMSI